MTAQDIIEQIKILPKGEFLRVSSFIHSVEEAGWDAWDEEIAQDIDGGKLDALLRRVDEDIQMGRTVPLP